MIFPVDASMRIADLEVKLSSSAVTLIWADDRISIKEIIKEKPSSLKTPDFLLVYFMYITKII